MFGRTRTLTIEHSKLGTLNWDRRDKQWVTQYSFAPTGNTVELRIDGTEAGPDPELVQAYFGLCSSFPTLLPKLADSVYAAIKPCFHADLLAHPDPGSAQEFWPLVQLESVSVQGHNHVSLAFAFVNEGIWDVAVITVELADGTITESWLMD